MELSIADVFCDAPFAGNPAAVVRCEGPIRPSDLLVLAREFNLPETCAYWIDAGTPTAAFATSAGPIAVCGHGLLAVLADVVRRDPRTAAEGLRCAIAGQAPSQWSFVRCSDRLVHIQTQWPRFPVYCHSLAPAEVLAAVGARESDISRVLPLAVYDCGVANALVPIANPTTLLELRPDPEALWHFCSEHRLTDVELYHADPRPQAAGMPIEVRSRNVFPYGVREEAATGGASVSLGAALHEYLRADEMSLRITQGVGRVGLIDVRVTEPAAGVRQVSIGGGVVLLASSSDLVAPSETVSREREL